MEKELKTVKIENIIPYERNPRKNDNAVEDVSESIKQTGYIAPIIVDENMVILCGHTRLKSLKSIGYKEVEVMVCTGMTEEQKKKYRLLDNKVAEKATWDFELLDWELQEVDWEGFDFGFQATDIDIYDDSEINDKNYNAPEKTELICPACGHKDSKERFKKADADEE